MEGDNNNRKRGFSWFEFIFFRERRTGVKGIEEIRGVRVSVSRNL
jgi:hypothetical protein